MNRITFSQKSFLLFTWMLADTAAGQTWQYAVSAVSGTAYSYITDIANDQQGNTYAVGNFSGNTMAFGSLPILNNHNTNSTYDAFLVKYDPMGNPIWAVCIGGAGDDKVFQIALDNHNHLYIAGSFNSTAYFGTYSLTSSNNADGFFAKYSTDGTALWVRKAGAYGYDEANSVACDGENAIYFGGHSYEGIILGSLPKTNSEYFLARYDSLGNAIWVRSASIIRGKSGLSYGTIDQMALDTQGNIFAVGIFQADTIFVGSDTITNSQPGTGFTDVLVLKYDGAGNLLWGDAIKGQGYTKSYGAATDMSGNLIISGYREVYLSYPLQMMKYMSRGYIIKYSANGIALWGQEIGQDLGNKESGTGGVTTDKQNNIYLAGGIPDQCRFDTISMSFSGSIVYIAKFDSAGSVQWVKYGSAANSTTSNKAITISRDDQDNLYIAGAYSSKITFGSNIINAASIQQSFIAKLGSPVTVIGKNQVNDDGISIFPNPFYNNLSIYTSTLPDKGTYLEILNIAGQVLFDKRISDSFSKIDLSFLAKGVYFVRVKSDLSSKTTKIVKN